MTERRTGPTAPIPDGAGKILRAARNLFMKQGGIGFTVRGVAKEAGLSLGAVQHFFRTKDELLAATLEFVLAQYRSEYDRLERELPFDAEARLLGAADVLVANVWREDIRKFFFGFYALSGNNPFARDLMNDLFDHHRRRFARYIQAARPQLGAQCCSDLSLQLTAMIDGFMIYTGPGAKGIHPRGKLNRLVRTSLLKLLGPAPRSG